MFKYVRVDNLDDATRMIGETRMIKWSKQNDCICKNCRLLDGIRWLLLVELQLGAASTVISGSIGRFAGSA